MGRVSKLSRSVSGKVVLVTGAGSGMGEATAYVFSDEGARVAAVDQNRDFEEDEDRDSRGKGFVRASEETREEDEEVREEPSDDDEGTKEKKSSKKDDDDDVEW